MNLPDQNEYMKALADEVYGKPIIKRAPKEEKELTVEELKQHLAYERTQHANYKRYYNDNKRTIHNLERELHDAYQRLDNTISLDYAHDVISKYAKLNKLGWKFAKTNTILDQFIAKLEFKDVPDNNDELVD